MYSSPLWLNFVLPEGVNPGLSMYYVSTACYIVVSILLSVLHVRAAKLFSLKGSIILFGAVASLGVAMEFASLALLRDPASWLFLVGSGLTGVCTAPISIRPGRSTRP